MRHLRATVCVRAKVRMRSKMRVRTKVMVRRRVSVRARVRMMPLQASIAYGYVLRGSVVDGSVGQPFFSVLSVNCSFGGSFRLVPFKRNDS